MRSGCCSKIETLRFGSATIALLETGVWTSGRDKDFVVNDGRGRNRTPVAYDVKCRLVASARLAVDPEGRPVYGLLQQGAGLVDAPGAVFGTASGCTNLGLDVSRDLAGSSTMPVR